MESYCKVELKELKQKEVEKGEEEKPGEAAEEKRAVRLLSTP